MANCEGILPMSTDDLPNVNFDLTKVGSNGPKVRNLNDGKELPCAVSSGVTSESGVDEMVPYILTGMHVDEPGTDVTTVAGLV